jgi:hypothetical protein
MTDSKAEAGKIKSGIPYSAKIQASTLKKKRGCEKVRGANLKTLIIKQRCNNFNKNLKNKKNQHWIIIPQIK